MLICMELKHINGRNIIKLLNSKDEEIDGFTPSLSKKVEDCRVIVSDEISEEDEDDLLTLTDLEADLKADLSKVLDKI